jgi:hypothetical protein
MEIPWRIKIAVFYSRYGILSLLLVLMGVELVRKPEAVLECCQLMPRKLKNNDLSCTAWERRAR